MDAERPIEYQLLQDVLALDLKVVDSDRQDFMDNTTMKITLRDDPDVLQGCAFALIYAIGVLSFDEGKPRGVSEIHFQEDDQWTADDMLRHLRFDKGALRFEADYVRGRMMKTRLTAHKDGTITLETTNRGEAARRWVSLLQGKKTLSVVK